MGWATWLVSLSAGVHKLASKLWFDKKPYEEMLLRTSIWFPFKKGFLASGFLLVSLPIVGFLLVSPFGVRF